MASLSTILPSAASRKESSSKSAPLAPLGGASSWKHTPRKIADNIPVVITPRKATPRQILDWVPVGPSRLPAIGGNTGAGFNSPWLSQPCEKRSVPPISEDSSWSHLDRGDDDSRSRLAPAIADALEEPLAMLALDEWTKAHADIGSNKAAAFESKLLYCEMQLHRLEGLASKLKRPSIMVTGAARGLIEHVLETLPPSLSKHAFRLLEYIDSALYSDERLGEADLAQLRGITDRPIDRVPYFAVTLRQEQLLERTSQRAEAMQLVVDEHMRRRQCVLNLLIRMQTQEKSVLCSWLFMYWSISWKHRRDRMAKTRVLTDPPPDMLSPFVCWRLYITLRKVARARTECEIDNIEASKIANEITALEIENEEQHVRFQEAMKTSHALREEGTKARDELERLQHLWDETQPDLLVELLFDSINLFVDLIVWEASFHHIMLRRKLATKQVSILMGAAAEDIELLEDMDDADFIIAWINLLLAEGRSSAKEILGKNIHLSNSSVQRLEVVVAMEDVGLGSSWVRDLRDSVALCVTFAVLKARKEGCGMSPADLWPLDERDRELRAQSSCRQLQVLLPAVAGRTLLSVHDILHGEREDLTMRFFACLFLSNPFLPDCGSEDAINAHHLELVLDRFETMADGLAWDSLQDPTPLIAVGEAMRDLSTAPAEQLLLRWVNTQLSGRYTQPIENFSGDLQSAEALHALLLQLAPELMEEQRPEDIGELAEQLCKVATRCVGLDILSASAIMDGRADILAAFLAQLFLTRPGLDPKPESMLAMHCKTLEDVCLRDYDLAKQLNVSSPEIMQFCERLEGTWKEITQALQYVRDVKDTMERLQECMHTFLGETLACRARGQARPMLDFKEARELQLYTVFSTGDSKPKDVLDSGALVKVEEVVKQHLRLLRDFFKRYCVPTSAGGGLMLDGLLRLYQECKMRSKDLAPHHLEGFFYDYSDLQIGQAKALSPHGFVLVLVQFARVKFRDASVAASLTKLIENHLKVDTTRAAQSVFHSMLYDPAVREVLCRHEEDLKRVFDVYAMLDTSSIEAMQNVTTINIKEFMMLMNHCEILDESLTEDSVKEIFDGIQQSAVQQEGHIDFDDSASSHSGLDDDDELAFSEFSDGIVAITAYKAPDPFTPFASRVDWFVLWLFAALRKYWSTKRNSPQIENMLNALQKKLGGQARKSNVAPRSREVPF